VSHGGQRRTLNNIFNYLMANNLIADPRARDFKTFKSMFTRYKGWHEHVVPEHSQAVEPPNAAPAAPAAPAQPAQTAQTDGVFLSDADFSEFAQMVEGIWPFAGELDGGMSEADVNGFFAYKAPEAVEQDLSVDEQPPMLLGIIEQGFADMLAEVPVPAELGVALVEDAVAPVEEAPAPVAMAEVEEEAPAAVALAPAEEDALAEAPAPFKFVPQPLLLLTAAAAAGGSARLEETQRQLSVAGNTEARLLNSLLKARAELFVAEKVASRKRRAVQELEDDLAERLALAKRDAHLRGLEEAQRALDAIQLKKRMRRSA